MKLKYMILGFLVLIALLLIVLPDIDSLELSDISKSIGIGILISCLVAFLEDPIKKIVSEPETLKSRFGLLDMHEERTAFGLYENLLNAETVNICATCLDGFIYKYKDILPNIFNNGKNNKKWKIILLSDKDGKLEERLKCDILKEPISKTRLERWVSSSKEFLELTELYPKNIDIEYTLLPPTCSFFIVDNNLYLTPYIHGHQGANSFTYHFRKTSSNDVYEKYQKSFDKHWDYLKGEGSNL